MEDHMYYAPFSVENEPKKRSKSHKQCSVFGCRSRSEFGLYTLPCSEKESARRKRWIIAIKMGVVRKHVLVCGKHFVEKDFIPKMHNGKGKKRLKKTAIPSQNLPKSSFHRSPSKEQKIAMNNRSIRAEKRLLRFDTCFLPTAPQADECIDNVSESNSTNVGTAEDNSFHASHNFVISADVDDHESVFWKNFFMDAGISNDDAEDYANIFTYHKAQFHLLRYLTDEHLKDMNIIPVFDRICILNHIKSLTGDNPAESNASDKKNNVELKQYLASSNAPHSGKASRCVEIQSSDPSEEEHCDPLSICEIYID